MGFAHLSPVKATTKTHMGVFGGAGGGRIGKKDRCNNDTQSSIASIGDPVTPHKTDCFARFKILLKFFCLYFIIECKMLEAKEGGRTWITFFLHRLEASSAQVRGRVTDSYLHSFNKESGSCHLFQ